MCNRGILADGSPHPPFRGAEFRGKQTKPEHLFSGDQALISILNSGSNGQSFRQYENSGVLARPHEGNGRSSSPRLSPAACPWALPR